MKASAWDELMELPPSDQPRVFADLDRLAKNPARSDLNIEPVKGWKGVWRLRVRDWRILFRKGEPVEVLRVARRTDTTYSPTKVASADGSGTYWTLVPRAHLAAEAAREAEAAADEADAWDEAFAAGATVEEGERLPLELTPGVLRRWHIPAQHHEVLSACRTTEDLLDVQVPPCVAARVVEKLYPRDVGQLSDDANYLVQGEEELHRYAKGDLTHLLLQLDPEQEALVQRDSNGPMLVRGGPGTGKTIVALHRVLRAARERSGARILFATFTRTLAAYADEMLRRVLRERGVDDAKLEVATVDHLARTRAPDQRTAVSTAEARRRSDGLLQG
ncbi:MAG: UvrD-helicase domain-containing protein [Trueperaceae bacterium]|nr:UvrD-helicase domain-containing protein [Trueperaceae bacterium]